ncbi:MAG TPA: hypothetical protein PKO47_14370, partial [bacterium]|nr:hypothetical protein [bacterium]
SFGWRRYTGIEADGGIIAMRSFGESAPIKALLEEFGFTTEAVVKLAKQKLKQFGKAAPKKTVSAKNKPAKKAKSKPKSKSTNKKTVSKKKQTSGKKKRK